MPTEENLVKSILYTGTPGTPEYGQLYFYKHPTEEFISLEIGGTETEIFRDTFTRGTPEATLGLNGAEPSTNPNSLTWAAGNIQTNGSVAEAAGGYRAGVLDIGIADNYRIVSTQRLLTGDRGIIQQGVCFRATDWNNCHFVFLELDDGQPSYLKYWVRDTNADTFVQEVGLGSTALGELQRNAEYIIDVALISNTLTVRVNNVTILDAITPHVFNAAETGVGIACRARGNSEWRDVVALAIT